MTGNGAEGLSKEGPEMTTSEKAFGHGQNRSPWREIPQPAGQDCFYFTVHVPFC